jgi:membrane protein implicated in regulation of membrane protease activity
MDWWVGWLIAMAVLGVIEMVTLTLGAGILALGAALAAVAGALDLPLPVQALVFGLTSAAGLAVVRPVALRHMSRPAALRTGARAVVGREARVTQEVTGESGRVRISGEEWSARAYDADQVIPIGASVDVFAIEGATALVHPRE